MNYICEPLRSPTSDGPEPTADLCPAGWSHLAFEGALFGSDHGADPESPTSRSSSSLRTNSPTGRILVVEDEDRIRELISDVLTRQGHFVVGVPDGAVAWTLLERDDAVFDLMILDLIMPNLSGYQVLKRLRDRCRSLPVIVCSGFAGDLSAAELHSLGVCRFLAKPFDLRVLLRAVQDLLYPRPTE